MSSPDDIMMKLAGGDRRSLGRAEEVVGEVLSRPELFDALIACILSDDPIVRMRAADAAEKITAQLPALLAPHKRLLMKVARECEQQEVRWHMALMLPRLRLTPKEHDAVVSIMTGYLADRGSIVKTHALQALADLSRHDAPLRARVADLLEEAVTSGTPAMRSRARKLLKEIGNEGLDRSA